MNVGTSNTGGTSKPESEPSNTLGEEFELVVDLFFGLDDMQDIFTIDLPSSWTPCS